MIHFFFRMKICQLKYFFNETLPWYVAWKLPRKITLFCFVRVYSTLGECKPDYINAYDNWVSGIGK